MGSPNLARSIFGLLLVLVTAACDPASYELRSAAPVNLFDELDAAEFGGFAARLVAEPEAAREQTLLRLRSNGNAIGMLAPFGGYGPPKHSSKRAGDDLPVELEIESGRVHLSGVGTHGVSARSEPFPISAGAIYRLRYHVETRGIRRIAGSEQGGVSLLLYQLDANDASRAHELLSNERFESRARVNANPSPLWVPTYTGTQPRTAVETEFWIDAAATHMVLSFDLSRPDDDRSGHRATGEIWFDAIELVARVAPLAQRLRISNAASLDHSLAVSVELRGDVTSRTADIRESIVAPAPSTLEFDVEVPAEPVLTFGYGLAPPAEARADGTLVWFEVSAIDPDGNLISLFQSRQPPKRRDGPHWSDVELPLDRFAGERIRLRFDTRGRSDAADDESIEHFPEAGMLWSYPQVSSRQPAGRTVLFVVVDTLSAKRVTRPRESEGVTPGIAQIAERGVSYRRAVSSAPWTLPSFASMFTGFDPFRHRAGERAKNYESGKRPLARGFETLAERLRANGWETIAWINNPYLTRAFGLDQGFRRFVDYGTRSSENASQGASEDVIRELWSPRAHDRFLFVHLMDPHAPYLPNAEFRKRVLGDAAPVEIRGKREFDLFKDVLFERIDLTPEQRATYRGLHEGVVAYADDQISRIFEAFRTFEAPGRSLMIIAADHGEEFWEHDTYEHGHSVYEELLAVPLVLYAPGVRSAGTEFSEAVSLQDVTPTVLDFAGLDPPDDKNAISLLPQLAGAPPPADRVLVSGNLLYGAERLAISKGPLKYIYNSRGTGAGSARSPLPDSIHELYDLSEDPSESSNRAASVPEQMRALHDELARRFVLQLAGHFGVYYEAPAATTRARLRGAIRVEGGASWDRRVRDLLWPAKDQQGLLSLRFERRPDADIAHFELEAPRALLGFALEQGNGPVSLSLSLEDEPIPGDAIEVAADRSQPTENPFAIPTDASNQVSAAQFGARYLLESADRSPFVAVARLRSLPNLEVSELRDAFPDDVRKQLEALGYFELE